ncbi:hypothetical protein [Gracilinema caldarium]|uniref:POTRA domain-containing protein n=1 Tax=Gracilinema caldarium (strain ATCC 51460 / DSM 7334 / H1) TaxID=744872 RepID=F8EXL8_GRAC1|nr:hypothetical protein [Gracilinema caldarium]AEJ19599.1 hypothetical protein Spica_1454 [Gracilinema caldarium DSM 7334]
MQKHLQNSWILFLIFTLFIFLDNLFAESTDAPYYIHSITYQITGITKAYALQNAAELKEGEVIVNNTALEQYIKAKTQLLLNNRVLAEANIQYTLGDPDTDGRIPVDLTVITTDTWNIIALPYFKYDSSNGLEISAKGRDYNFLGTMQPLKIDIGYTIDRQPLNDRAFDKGAFFIDIDSNFPFKAWNLDWNFDFDHYFGYTDKYGFEYENKTGLSLSLPIQFTTLTLSAYQGVSINEENEDKYKAEYGDRYQDYWYLSNWMRLDWSIPTPIQIDGFSKVLYIPSLQIKQNYRPFGEIGEERGGPIGTIEQTISFGRVDWIRNFRRGIDVHLTNTNDYNFYKTTWNKSIHAELIGHYPLINTFELSGRVQGYYYFDEADDKGGLPLRGILDSAVTTEYGLYTNLDLPIRVILFMPSEWFKSKKLRIFDIEQQWTPFIDMAMVKDSIHDRSFTFDDMLITSGIEVVTFPLFIRSFYLRISVGFNLREAVRLKSLPNGDNREIFIGLGHHY